MRTKIAMVAAALAVVGISAGVLTLDSPDPVAPVVPGTVVVSGVHCPTEDSCAVDYRDGHWTITEVTP